MKVLSVFLFVLGILFITLLSLFLVSVYRLFKQDIVPDLETGNDYEFPGTGGIPHKFDNFYLFKKLVYYFAKRDEEIKRYLMDRKSRHDSIHAPVPNSNVDREAVGTGVSPDLQRGEHLGVLPPDSPLLDGNCRLQVGDTDS